MIGDTILEDSLRRRCQEERGIPEIRKMIDVSIDNLLLYPNICLKAGPTLSIWKR